jgi:hypothetical protein
MRNSKIELQNLLQKRQNKNNEIATISEKCKFFSENKEDKKQADLFETT